MNPLTEEILRVVPMDVMHPHSSVGIAYIVVFTTDDEELMGRIAAIVAPYKKAGVYYYDNRSIMHWTRATGYFDCPVKELHTILTRLKQL